MNKQHPHIASSETTLSAVLSCTEQLVGAALQQDWHRVLEGLEHRRQLLDSMQDALSDRWDAMREAIQESERAMHCVVAHAVLSKRWNGAELAALH